MNYRRAGPIAREQRTAVRISFALILFLVYALFAASWCSDWEWARIKLYELCLVLCVVLSLSIGVLSRDADQLQVGFFGCWLCFGIALALLALSTSGLEGRISTAGGGPNIFGRTMGLTAIAAMFVLGRGAVPIRWLSIAVTIMALLLVVRSGSRGAIFATLLAISTLLSTIDVRVFLRRTCIVVAMMAGLFVTAKTTEFGQSAYEMLMERVVYLTFEMQYVSGRDVLFADAIAAGQTEPVYGIGLNGYRTIQRIYPHNIFLEIFCELGCVGLALFLAPCVMAAVWLLRNGKCIDIYILAALALVFGSAQVSGDLYDSRGVFLLLILLVIPNTKRGQQGVPAIPQRRQMYS